MLNFSVRGSKRTTKLVPQGTPKIMPSLFAATVFQTIPSTLSMPAASGRMSSPISLVVPFAGSGSECVLANIIKVPFLGIEINPEYANAHNNLDESLEFTKVRKLFREISLSTFLFETLEKTL